MIVSGDLGSRQSVRLRTNIITRSMERGRDEIDHTLTDDTEDATSRIREIERRGRSTELGSNHVIQERLDRLQKRSAIAFQPRWSSPTKDILISPVTGFS